MRLALSQLNSKTGDIQGNASRIISVIEHAKEKKADIIVFPEMALTGYCISDLVDDRSFLHENKKALEKIAHTCDGIIAVVGYVDYEESDDILRRYNAAAVLENGKVVGTTHKTLLPNYRYFDDKRFFVPGKERNPISVTIQGIPVKLGVSICEDMWDKGYEIKPIRELADKGAEIILNINASPFVLGKRHERHKIIQKHVSETHLPFVYVNTVGAGDNGKNIIPFDGQSMVYDAHGSLIHLGKQFEEEFSIIDIDKNAKSLELPVANKEKELYEALVMGLRDYAQKTGFTRAIESVSGGIDSALGLAITVDAFGAENVKAFSLPSRYNSDTTKSIAKELAHNFNVEYRIIPIQKINDTIVDIFEKEAHNLSQNKTKENIQSRIRGLLMMIESNDTNALLISNGNKTEIALGYATLYGDMCGGISVIGDLSKHEVYLLSAYVNKRYGKEMIPKGAFDVIPSAELSTGQVDPFDYPIVSPLVDEFIEHRKSPAEVVTLFTQKKLDTRRFPQDIYEKHTVTSFKALVYDLYNRTRVNVFKRIQAPPIIAVTERAFGFDLRETLINGWKGE